MALDYRLFFETDLSPDELADLITNKKAMAREPLPCGIAFQLDDVPCAFVTEDAEDRSFRLKEYGFSPTVHLAARLDKTRPERDLAVFKRLVAAVLLAFDGDVVLTFDDGGVVLRRHGGVGAVEPGWSEQFDDLLPLLGERTSSATLAGETLDFCLHLVTHLTPAELVDMIAKVGMQARQPLAHFAQEFSATERADLKTGSGVTELRPTTRGAYFRFDGVQCLLEEKDEEDRNAAMAAFGFTPPVHLHMHLDPELRRIQLAEMKHLIVTVLDTLQFGDAVLVAFTENPVVLSRRGRAGVIKPDWSHEFGDLAPLLGERWSVGTSSSIGHQPQTGEPLTAETPFYYFGVLEFNVLNRQHEHRLYRVAPQPAPGEQVQLPWKEMELDAALCPGFRSGGTPSDYQVEGLARIHHRDGWTALAFWDRSMDVRPGSNSVFIAQGEYDFAGMKALAQRRCPKVWGRWFFEVRQEDTSAS